MVDRLITAVYVEIGCVTVFEVLEEELESMEGGSPAQLAETTTFGLLGLAIPMLVGLTQLDIEKQRVAFTVATSSGVVCLVAGFVVGAFWWLLAKKRAKIFAKVRKRKKAGILADGTEQAGVPNG